MNRRPRKTFFNCLLKKFSRGQRRLIKLHEWSIIIGKITHELSKICITISSTIVIMTYEVEAVNNLIRDDNKIIRIIASILIIFIINFREKHQ